MIDITGTDLRKFVAKAYELSVPQGLGILHFTPEPLSEQYIDRCLATSMPHYCLCGMDYVHGRAVKMRVYVRDGKWLINDRWYDHSHEALMELLSSEGVVNNGTYEEPAA